MKLGIFKVIGKSFYKSLKAGAIVVGSIAVANGPQTADVLSSINPWAGLAFSLIYTGIDAYKHRDKA